MAKPIIRLSQYQSNEYNRFSLFISNVLLYSFAMLHQTWLSDHVIQSVCLQKSAPPTLKSRGICACARICAAIYTIFTPSWQTFLCPIPEVACQIITPHSRHNNCLRKNCLGTYSVGTGYHSENSRHTPSK